MKTLPRLLYLLCFGGLALVAALALNGAVEPSVATSLVRSVILATLFGAAGLIHRRLWPISLVLLPLGAYLLLRTTLPIPGLVEGAGGQYHFYVEQLRLGADAYMSQVFPLNSSAAPELEILLAFSTYWLVGAAAFLSLSLRRPIPGTVLVLILLGFGLTVDGSPRVVWSALLFLVLAACLLVLSRSLDRMAWTLRDIVAGGAVGVVASLLALLLLVSVPSAVANPWQDWRAWDPFGQGPSTYTFNWLQMSPKWLDPANDRVIMTVESPLPSYWRASALETFTLDSWTTSMDFPEVLEPSGDSPYVYSFPQISDQTPGEEAEQTYTVEGVNTKYFFVGGDPVSLRTDQNLPLGIDEMRVIRSRQFVGPALTYKVTAVIPDLEPENIVGRGTDYPDELDPYLVLPFDRAAQVQGDDKEAVWRETVVNTVPEGWEWGNLYSLNQEIVGDATDPYDITLRIENYLRRYFEYSLTPLPTEYSSRFAAFLFDTHSGYCQHFAGTMALLLRFNSIPARVAVGFATGEEEQAEQQPGVYTVSSNNAHAWVEAYFPGVGWVAFDPTPSNNIDVTLATDPAYPGFINPFFESDLNDPGAPPVEPPRENITEGQTVDIGGGNATQQSWLAKVPWLPWVLGLALLLVVWPVARNQWRRRRLRRGTREDRLQASIALLRRDMADGGIAVRSSYTLEDIFSTLDSVLHINPSPLLAVRAEAVLFGGYQATETDLSQAETLRRTATARLRRRQGWLRRVLAWYGLPQLPFWRRPRGA